MRVVDMHCDTISVMEEMRRQGKKYELRKNKGHLDIERMKKSGYLLQNFALYVDADGCKDPWQQVLRLYEVYQHEMENNQNLIRPVTCYEDIVRNAKDGFLSGMLTVEEGAVCQGEIGKLEQLFRMGVRMLTLTWNYPNELGFPNLDGRKRKEQKEKGLSSKEAFAEFFYTPNLSDGLTERGREFVARMEELGMIIDVSHLSDKGFYDVLAATKKPFVASHSNARAVAGCVRNLTDDMIRSLGERGGCMGLNYCADFLEDPVWNTPNPGNVEAAVRHALHITNVGGMEVLGLGSDFDGIDTNQGLPGVQSMEILWEALHKAGFTQTQLDMIFEQNVLRVYRDTLS